MSVAFDHRDPGTSEQDWTRAAPWSGAEEFTLRGDRLVVLAAHPDDETLGAGGLIALAASRGLPVGVVVVTDGEAAQPGAGDGLARERRHELIDALHELGAHGAVHFLGIRDGGIREAADDVRRALHALVPTGTEGGLTIAVPWWGDGHRDHRVLGELALEFAAAGAHVLGYPIWLWHWGEPATVDASGWRMLPLAASTQAAKRRALTRHASQTAPAGGEEPVLHAGMIAHFERPFEVYVDAAAASASTPVSSFDARYARTGDPWGVDVRWYELRKRDILLASLPRAMFSRALEIGCGTGALTERLAGRASEVLAVDVSPHAADRARERTADAPHVVVDTLDVRTDWPDGRFDLVVLAEVGYYWSPSDLADVLDRIEDSLTDDGILVICHWRHPIAEAPLSGDAVHAAVGARRALARVAHHDEEDFLLDVLARGGAGSVARESGLLA